MPISTFGKAISLQHIRKILPLICDLHNDLFIPKYPDQCCTKYKSYIWNCTVKRCP